MMRFGSSIALLLFLLLSTGATHGVASEQVQLVLVASERSQVEPLTSNEIRKLFLGIPVIQHQRRLEPLNNVSDPLLNEVFLQKIVFMSTQKYERMLVSQVFRLGGHRPAQFSETEKLVGVLKESPITVSYMWLKTAQQTPGIKVVQELWHGTVE